MRNRAIYALFLLVALAAVLSAPATRPLRADEKPQPAPLKLKVGDTAPDFTLRYYDGAKVREISLHEFRGKKNVVVAFFVFAFTGG
jgi:cytochrome oxidase Cu insertion factor (SCO1/SenC/PrrC family)